MVHEMRDKQLKYIPLESMAGVLNWGYPYPLGVWEPNAGDMGLDLWIFIYN